MHMYRYRNVNVKKTILNVKYTPLTHSPEEYYKHLNAT